MAAEGRNLLEVVLNTDIAKKFNEVDNSISKLQTTIETAASSANKFAEALKNAASSFGDASGTNSFIENIQKLIETLNGLSANAGAKSIEQTKKGIESIGEAAILDIDSVQKLIDAINKIPEAFSKTSSGSSSSGGSKKSNVLDGLLFDTKELEEKKAQFSREIQELEALIKAKNPEFQKLLQFKMGDDKGLLQLFDQEIKNLESEINRLGFDIQKIGLLNRENFNPKDVEGHIAAIQQLRKQVDELQKEKFELASGDVKKDPQIQQMLADYDALYERIRKTIEERKKVEQEISGKTQQNEAIKERIKEIESLKKQIKSLEEQYERLKVDNKAFSSDGKISSEAKQILDEKKALEEKLKMYQMSADEAIKQEQRKNEEIEKEEKSASQRLKALYDERLDYEKKKAGVETKIDSKMLQGKDFEKENELAANYQSRIDSINKSIKELENDYPELAKKAKEAYDTKKLEAQVAVSEKYDSVIEKTVKSVQSLADAKRKEREEERNNKIGLSGGDTPRTIREYEIAIKNLRNEIKNLDVETQKGQINEYNKRITEYKKKVDDATGATNRFRQENIKLNNVLQQVAGAFGVYLGLQAFTNLARRVRETTGEFELQHRALQAIIQDTQAANQIWEKTIKLAVRSPYNVKQLVTYTKQLAAYRVESDKLYDTTKMLADISSGLGVDMQRLILAYGQVKAANYLRGQELRQFSEAGINILGELAKYFTELKGQAVSTGQVFEMVSKRMVKFEDVTEVLHRLTEEGGAFYKMQEIQAETLSGIYANLKDRVDLALNSMGEDTRGILVGLAKAATFLLENWRAFSNMLTSGMIIWGFYKLEVLRAARAKGAFTAATIQATAAEGGFIGMLAKSKLALKAFATSIKTIFTTGLGIAGVVIASLIAIGKAIYDHNKKIDEARKKYDELNQGINKNGISGFNRLNDAIQENNKKISDNIKLRDKAKEAGDKEKEVQIQAEINQLQEKNNKLVDDIRGKYSELSNEIQTTAEGIVEIGAGARELAHIQTMTTDITNIFGENAGRRSDITETTKDLELAFNELELATSQFNTQFNYWINNVERELEKSTVFSESFKESIHSIVDNKTLSSFEKYNLILEKLNNNYYQYSGVFGSIGNEFVKGIEKAQSKVDKLEGSISEEVGRASEKIKEMYDVAGDKESAQKASEGFIKNLGFLKGNVSDFLARMFSEKLDIEVTITPNDEKKELLEWQDKVNEFIQKTVGSKNRETTIPISAEITNADETRDAYRKMVKGLIDDEEEIIRVFEKAKKEGTKQLVYTVDEYNNAVSKLPDLKALYDAIGGKYKKKGGKSNPALDLLNKQIDAIKNAAKQYDEYKKRYEDTKAFDKTKESVGDLFKELGISNALKDAKDWKEDSFADNVEKWLNGQMLKAGKDGKIAVKKYVSTIAEGFDEKTFKNSLDVFKKQMEEAISDYNMFSELNKLGIGKDFASILFGVNTNDLKQLRDALDKYKMDNLEEYLGGTETTKAIEEMEKKITEIEDKEQKERLKKYVAYTKQAMTERAKIEVEGLQELSEIEKTFQKEIEKAQKGSNTERAEQIQQLLDSAVEGSKRATNEKLQKQAWEDFKGSDMYVEMFNDIGNASTKVIEAIQDKITQLRGSLKDLNPSDLKAITQEITKLEDELIKRNPAKAYFDLFKQVRDLKKQGKGEDALMLQIGANDDEIEKLNDQIAGYEILIEKRRQFNQKQIDSEGESNYIKMNMSLQSQVEQWKKLIEQKKKDNAATAEELKTYKRFRNASKGFADYLQNMGGRVASIFSDIMSNLEAFGGETTNTSEAWGDLFSSIMSIIATIPNYILLMKAAGVAANGALGVVGWIVTAVEVLVALIKGVANIKNANIDKQIDSYKDKVDALADAYDRLEKKFDAAWDIQTLRQYNTEMKRNLEQQLAYYDDMIKAEQSRKKPDEKAIREYENTAQEIRDRLAEQGGSFLEAVGGLGSDAYKDAAHGFVDAWYDAFKETGDGLEGLKENFNEIIENMVKKQAIIRLTDALLKPLFEKIDEAAADGAITTAEMSAINNLAETTFPELNEKLKAFFSSLGLFGQQAEGELDGLQKGIQGVTEQTAEIIAAYMNSIRYYVIDNNTKLGQIISSLQDSTGTFNPMIAELQNIRQQAEDIRNLLFSWRETSGVPSMRVTIV